MNDFENTGFRVTSPRDHFVMVPFWIARATELSPAALKVYLAIGTFANFTTRDGAHPSQKTLATMTGLSIPTVKRAIKELKDFGAIQITVEIKETGRVNHYHLPFDRGVGSNSEGGGITSDTMGGITHDPLTIAPSNNNQLNINSELEKMMLTLKGLYPRRPGDTHRWQQVKKKIAGKGKDWELMLAGVKNYALRVSDPQFVMNAGKFFEKEVWRDYLEEQESSDPEVRRLRRLLDEAGKRWSGSADRQGA